MSPVGRVEVEHALTNRIDVKGTFKSGLFANMVGHDTLLMNNSPDVTFAGSKNDVGLGGVIDAALEFSLRHGPWRLFGGYRALVLSGMGTAGGQFDFSINEDPDAVLNDVNHQGTVVLHGPFAGVMAEF